MNPRRQRKRRKRSLPDWLLAALSVLRPPENLTVSEWADRYRVLDEKTSAQPGPWKTSTTPYLQGVMDAFNDPDIEEIIFCKPTQVGGTETLNNMIGYVIAQDPAPALVVYPTLELAEFASKNRVQPMIDLAPVLKQRYHFRESKDLELQFDSMYIVLAGANSPASLASRPIRYLFLDEVDKYPPRSGKESDPISLARERTKTFAYNKKIFMTSTPTVKTGNIWTAKENADELRCYYIPCPHCGQYQKLSFKQIKWPKGVKEPADAQDLAWYECQYCKEKITDAHKPAMLRNGRWEAEKKKGQYSRKVAFYINTLYSPWVRFGDVAYEFLKSKDFPDLLQNFVNSWLAEPWEDTQVKINKQLVLERQSGYEEGVVPDEAVLLTGGVDVQRGMLYWTIRAWGPLLTSWNIAHGIAMSFEDIEVIMNTTFSKRDGTQYQVNLCAIDSGDQTEDVYDFCAMNQDWAIPVKGSSNPMLSRYRISTIDKINSKAYGMRLVLVDTSQYKSMIAARLNRPNGKGSWMVYQGCDEEYAEQVTSEHKVLVKKGDKQIEVWQPKTPTAANHYLDCEVYAAAAADLLHVRYLQEETPAEEPSRKPEPTQNGFIKTDGSWINQKGGWIR